jgi:hypothetical protein
MQPVIGRRMYFCKRCECWRSDLYCVAFADGVSHERKRVAEMHEIINERARAAT